MVKACEDSKGYNSERLAAALARFAGPAEAFWWFEAGQTAALNAVRNRWLQPVAPRVAMEKACGGFERLPQRKPAAAFARFAGPAACRGILAV